MRKTHPLNFSCLKSTKRILALTLFLFQILPLKSQPSNVAFNTSIENAIELGNLEHIVDAKRNLDSLAKSLESIPDSSKTNEVFQLVKGYNSIRDFESSARILERQILISDSLKDSISLANGLYKLGLSYKRLGLSAASRDAFKRCMILCESLNDEFRLALTLNQIGLMEKKRATIKMP